MMDRLRNAGKWLWAFVAATALVLAMLMAAVARSRQAKHDNRLKDLQDDQSTRRWEKVGKEVEAARKAAETAKKRKENAEKRLDELSKVDPDMRDLLSRYNADRLPKRSDPP
jgi:flagellar biosynthesis/type III secretory pathway M-ring protein FliF/YscJ